MTALGLALSVLIGVSLGFFGGGGSILTVPLLVYVFELEPKVAIASSLLIVGVASVSGAVQHARAGNLELRTGALFGAAGMAGAYLGARAAAFVDGTLLLLLFAAMMILTAGAMWRGRRDATPTHEPTRSTRRLLLQGLAVGGFTGLVGAGGGFLIVPALALWAGLPMASAVGTSLFVIVLNTLAGFSGYLGHVSVDPALIAAIGFAAILGSFGGARLARRIDPATLRRSFAGFVGVMAVLILVREADAWLETAADALPASLPQALFVLCMLAIGIGAGRATRRAPLDPLADRAFNEGAGI